MPALPPLGDPEEPPAPPLGLGVVPGDAPLGFEPVAEEPDPADDPEGFGDGEGVDRGGVAGGGDAPQPDDAELLAVLDEAPVEPLEGAAGVGDAPPPPADPPVAPRLVDEELEKGLGASGRAPPTTDGAVCEPFEYPAPRVPPELPEPAGVGVGGDLTAPAAPPPAERTVVVIVLVTVSFTSTVTTAGLQASPGDPGEL